MNKKIYLLPLLLLALVFASCEETKEISQFDNWRVRNELFMDSLQQVYDAKTDPSLECLVPLTNDKVKIFYKNNTPADAVVGGFPLFSDSVQVYYRGFYIFGESFGGNFSGEQFNARFLDEAPNVDFDVPFKCYVDPYKSISQSNPYQTVIIGWSEVLQRMKVGQRWMVFLPWQMCYGSAEQGTIPGYSALVYNMQLQTLVK